MHRSAQTGFVGLCARARVFGSPDDVTIFCHSALRKVASHRIALQHVAVPAESRRVAVQYGKCYAASYAGDAALAVHRALYVINGISYVYNILMYMYIYIYIYNVLYIYIYMGPFCCRVDLV